MINMPYSELWVLVVLVVSVTGALIHCYLMDSENKREFGEVSDTETKALYTELQRMRRARTIKDITELLLSNGLVCLYDETTEEFMIYDATVLTTSVLGTYHFKSYQDALDWLQVDYLNLTTQIK